MNQIWSRIGYWKELRNLLKLLITVCVERICLTETNFDSYLFFSADRLPAWKVMKTSADEKSANQQVQQALQEYGQLLKSSLFGEMPTEERYDVFLSMSKLLKLMGFHQKAELLLYEAMSYTEQPFEAHLQLGLIFLDKVSPVLCTPACKTEKLIHNLTDHTGGFR